LRLWVDTKEDEAVADLSNQVESANVSEETKVV
jgi:hypothetical protein